MRKDGQVFELHEWFLIILGCLLLSVPVIYEHTSIVDGLEKKAAIEKSYKECLMLNKDPDLIVECKKVRESELRGAWHESNNVKDYRK